MFGASIVGAQILGESDVKLRHESTVADGRPVFNSVIFITECRSVLTVRRLYKNQVATAAQGVRSGDRNLFLIQSLNKKALNRRSTMILQTIPKTTALQAQALVNAFLFDRLPDRFTADQPQWSKVNECWQVPVILAYPTLGVLGIVGEVKVAGLEEVVTDYTPIEEMKRKGLEFYQINQDAIEADFS
jgi:hypothetical protein